MFLKSVELFGFKSFADKSKLMFSEGISALLGPNGCGKSNIVDAIKWVLGEQSTKTLRASKMGEVIFNGTEHRKALNVAEVTLVISNDEGYLPMDVSEISIKRRVHRSGEGEYFINGTPVKLKDIRELFFDTGIGKAAYSILEQGKIDQILSHRPEDRRYIFEEAAGITRYKMKSAEAERKLGSTEDNLRQINGILKEVTRSYKTLKAQAQRAQRYQELQKEIFELEVDIQLSRLKELLTRREDKQNVLKEGKQRQQELKEKISALQQELESGIDQVNELSKKRVEIHNRLQRLDELRSSKANQISLLYDRMKDFSTTEQEAQNRRQVLQERIDRDAGEIEQYVQQQKQVLEDIEQTEGEIEQFQKNIEYAEERIAENEQTVETEEQRIGELERAQRELHAQLNDLTEDIVSQLDRELKESGYSASQRSELEEQMNQRFNSLKARVDRNVSYFKDLRGSAGSLTPEMASEMRTLMQETGSSLADLQELFNEYTEAVPTFIDDFLAPEGIITRKREIDRQISSNSSQITQKRSLIGELRNENTQLREKLRSYLQTLEDLRVSLADLSSTKQQLASSIQDLQRRVSEQEVMHDEALRDAEIAQSRAQETQERINALDQERQDHAREEKQLRNDVEGLDHQVSEYSNTMEVKRSALERHQEERDMLNQRVDRAEVEVESLEEDINGVYTQFEELHARSLREFDSRVFSEHMDRMKAREKLRSLRTELRELGQVNHMAAEEFAEVKERYDFLHKQMNDLIAAKQNLEQITTEIKEKSQQLFTETYNQIKTNFHTMFRRLFGGGRGELRLVDPKQVLTSGIEILAQPPGKKLERISLLSGGERSLTAVALLFATYMVKPSPFCILDEIDAALDEANVGRFLGVLEDFGRDSQFIIITHNKKTIIGASAMLGVTMEEPGVSKVITYRLSDQPQRQTAEV